MSHISKVVITEIILGIAILATLFVIIFTTSTHIEKCQKANGVWRQINSNKYGCEKDGKILFEE